jgi:hypothetical protein
MFAIKGTAVTPVTPALDLLLHLALEQKHILVRVEMLPEGTLSVIRSLTSGTKRNRSIFAFPRGGSMSRHIRLRIP